MFRGAKKRTFRFGKKNVSFPKVETFRFADYNMSPFKEKEAYFRRLLDVANVNALSPKERATYDENLKIYRDWKATMEYAVEEAETKGKAEGERLATLRNARNMKKAGVALSLVAECTGLSLEIIQSL